MCRPPGTLCRPPSRPPGSRIGRDSGIRGPSSGFENRGPSPGTAPGLAPIQLRRSVTRWSPIVAHFSFTFIPWHCSGLYRPQGSYPNHTKKPARRRTALESDKSRQCEFQRFRCRHDPVLDNLGSATWTKNTCETMRPFSNHWANCAHHVSFTYDSPLTLSDIVRLTD